MWDRCRGQHGAFHAYGCQPPSNYATPGKFRSFGVRTGALVCSNAACVVQRWTQRLHFCKLTFLLIKISFQQHLFAFWIQRLEEIKSRPVSVFPEGLHACRGNVYMLGALDLARS